MDCLWVCQYLNTFYILHQTHKFIANPYWETGFSFHSSKPDSMLHINVFIQIEMGKIAVDHTKITREFNYKKLYLSPLQIHNPILILLNYYEQLFGFAIWNKFESQNFAKCQLFMIFFRLFLHFKILDFDINWCWLI